MGSARQRVVASPPALPSLLLCWFLAACPGTRAWRGDPGGWGRLGALVGVGPTHIVPLPHDQRSAVPVTPLITLPWVGGSALRRAG